jgi:hypothetical protein|tara:strand:- start:359 stop:673 length:315 start_codon:yes stop_codon:yes gene_type:complete
MDVLPQREAETLRYAIEYRAAWIIRVSPTVKEIFDHLNKILSKRANRKPALVSAAQAHRAIAKLRKGGYLVDPDQYPEIRRVSRNVAPTRRGKQWYKQHIGSLP